MVLHHSRRHRLQKLFSAFPDGWPGFGLVILRLAIALNGFAEGFHLITGSDTIGPSGYALALGSALVSLVLLIGLLTPVAALIATCGYLIHGAVLLAGSGSFTHAMSCSELDMAIMSLTLVLLGPGAYSVDARLFGRREIIIPDGRRPGA